MRKSLPIWLTACAVALGFAACAAETEGREAAADSEAFLSRIEGVYKDRFENGLIDDSTYQSEDILEIVKLSERTAYVNLNLNFFNGHKCFLWGVANVSAPDRLVYDMREKTADGAACQLTIQRKGDALALSDPGGHCAIKTCGARGAYSVKTFPLKARRKIRYMPVILKSQEYRDALEEYDSQSAP